jgi:hypothetical protein
MQVFIVGSPLETAKALSKRHLNNQINEASIILDALNGAKAWSNHPCVLQYRGCEKWLEIYKGILMSYEECNFGTAILSNMYIDKYRPEWHTQDYYDQMKRRLYTKDPEHYKQWAEYGKSDCNWYFVDGEWRKYVNGKRIE